MILMENESEKTVTMKSNFFTLAELAIEAVSFCLIAVLLLSAYGRIRPAAEKNLCYDNMMRIGRGVMQYASDHADMLPPYNSNALAITYFDAIYPYVQKEAHPEDRFFVRIDPRATDDVWWCPTHLRVEPNKWIRTARLSMSSSYGYNRAFTLKKVTLRELKKPAEMIVNTECGSYRKETGVLSGYYIAEPWSVVARHDVETPSRKEGISCSAFADGSVREIPIRMIYGGKNWRGKLLPWDMDLDGK